MMCNIFHRYVIFFYQGIISAQHISRNIIWNMLTLYLYLHAVKIAPVMTQIMINTGIKGSVGAGRTNTMSVIHLLSIFLSSM